MEIKEYPCPIVIYIASHNMLPANIPDYSVPIQAGAALSNEKICKIGDNTGDNISVKNREYCELTVWYWIWKNDPHKIVGLNHYRRMFQLDYKTINQLLEKFDIIVPEPYFFRYSLEKEYETFHHKADLEMLIGILHENYPEWDDYVSAIFHSNRLIPYNMFIASKKISDEYFSWLFPILFELENRLDLTNYTAYQKRVMGFLAERLFTLYIYARKLKTFSCPIQIPEKSNVLKKIKFGIGQKFNQVYFKIKKYEKT